MPRLRRRSRMPAPKGANFERNFAAAAALRSADLHFRARRYMRFRTAPRNRAHAGRCVPAGAGEPRAARHRERSCTAPGWRAARASQVNSHQDRDFAPNDRPRAGAERPVHW